MAWPGTIFIVLLGPVQLVQQILGSWGSQLNMTKKLDVFGVFHGKKLLIWLEA